MIPQPQRLYLHVSDESLTEAVHALDRRGVTLAEESVIAAEGRVYTLEAVAGSVYLFTFPTEVGTQYEKCEVAVLRVGEAALGHSQRAFSLS
jgi:hypothetical protein